MVGFTADIGYFILDGLQLIRWFAKHIKLFFGNTEWIIRWIFPSFKKRQEFFRFIRNGTNRGDILFTHIIKQPGDNGGTLLGFIIHVRQIFLHTFCKGKPFTFRCGLCYLLIIKLRDSLTLFQIWTIFFQVFVHGAFLFLQLFLIHIRGRSLPFDVWVHQGCTNLHGLFLSQFAALSVFPLFFLGKYGGDLIVIV